MAHKRKQSSTSVQVASLPSLNDRILRFDEVRLKTGLCRSHIHQLVPLGKFPRPLKLVAGGRASGWLESDINQWIADRVAASRGDGVREVVDDAK